jgi:REP element-mobilizing transposase RayT
MTFDSLHDPTHLYFITATLCGWKRLFLNPSYSKIVLDSLTWLRRKKRMLLFAFVLMPSHLHAIIKPRERSIGKLLDEFGSFTAHAILRQLRQDNEKELLEFFALQRRDKRHKHSIWQDIQAKNVFSIKFLNQKMEYIHNNPVDKDWKLVDDRADYRYSSACFYDRNITPIIEIDDVRDYL